MEADVKVHSFNSQLTTSGPGLGTGHFRKVPVIKPLLIVGPGTRSYDAGEAWFEAGPDTSPLFNANLSRDEKLD